MEANQCRLFVKQLSGAWFIFNVMRDASTGEEGPLTRWNNDIYSKRDYALSQILYILKRDRAWMKTDYNFYSRLDNIDSDSDVLIEINMLKSTVFGHVFYNFDFRFDNSVDDFRKVLGWQQDEDNEDEGLEDPEDEVSTEPTKGGVMDPAVASEALAEIDLISIIPF